MKKYQRMHLIFIRQYIKQIMEYKVDFVVGVLGVFLAQGLNLLFLNVIFQHIPYLEGWTFQEIAFIYGFSLIVWTLPKFLLFLVCIPFATLIYTSLKIATASIAFWTKQSGAMIYIFYMFNDFAKYPISIYNSLLRWLISFIVPFAFTAYYPASYFLQEKDVFFNVGGLMLISMVFFVISLKLWDKGLDSYESAGS